MIDMPAKNGTKACGDTKQRCKYVWELLRTQAIQRSTYLKDEIKSGEVKICCQRGFMVLMMPLVHEFINSLDVQNSVHHLPITRKIDTIE